MDNTSDFTPNWASIPGATITDLIARKSMSIEDLSIQIGCDLKQTTQLLTGYLRIDNSIANKLQAAIGGSVEFWLQRESTYRSAVERLTNTEGKKWVDELPTKSMIKFGWIQNSSGTAGMLNECLRYFNVPDIWTWRNKYNNIHGLASFRKSDKIESTPASLLAWIRYGEIQAEKAECAIWSRERFISEMSSIKILTRQKDSKSFLPKLQSICAACGVALVIAQTPEHCAASGMTKFINSSKAMILLSFRYKSDDHFWFTFFHEAGHVILHAEKQVFFDEAEKKDSTQLEEKEANEFAFKILFPGTAKEKLQTMTVSEREIKNLANEAGVSLGIVVGQLQHLGRVKPNHFNGFKRRYDLEGILNSNK